MSTASSAGSSGQAQGGQQESHPSSHSQQPPQQEAPGQMYALPQPVFNPPGHFPPYQATHSQAYAPLGPPQQYTTQAGHHQAGHPPTGYHNTQQPSGCASQGLQSQPAEAGGQWHRTLLESAPRDTWDPELIQYPASSLGRIATPVRGRRFDHQDRNLPVYPVPDWGVISPPKGIRAGAAVLAVITISYFQELKYRRTASWEGLIAGS